MTSEVIDPHPAPPHGRDNTGRSGWSTEGDRDHDDHDPEGR